MARTKKTDEEIKSEIIMAARELFIHYGYNKTTMEDIAKAVHKGKSTLYYYYKSKEEIIADVVDHEVISLFNIIYNKIANYHTAYEKFIGYYTMVIEETSRLMNLYGLLANDLNTNLSFLTAKYDNHDYKLFQEILHYGIETKECLSIKVEEVDNIAMLISQVNTHFIPSTILEAKDEKWKYFILTLGEILFRGLR